MSDNVNNESNIDYDTNILHKYSCEDLFRTLSHIFRVLRDEFYDFASNIINILDYSSNYLTSHSTSSTIYYIRDHISLNDVVSTTNRTRVLYSRLRDLSTICSLHIERNKRTKITRAISKAVVIILLFTSILTKSTSITDNNISYTNTITTNIDLCQVSNRELKLILDATNNMARLTISMSNTMRALRCLLNIRSTSSKILAQKLSSIKDMITSVIDICTHSLSTSVENI